MSTILEHFKPPPLASDPPAKTRFWPAPPTQSSGGILQRPKLSNISASSSTSQLSVPTNPPTPLSPTASTRVSFAPLPNLTERKRRNSITLGVAARSAALRKMKEARNVGPPPGESQPISGPRPAHPQSRGSTASLGRRNHSYQHYQAGQPRPRRTGARGEFKDDQVIDLGEVAMDAGKKLWRAINQKSRKTSAASESGRPEVSDQTSVGGPTVGASGHNTEREILVRGFAVPEDIPDEEEEERDEEEEREAAEEQAHRIEDYVADMRALRVSDNSSESFPVDPSAVSPTHPKAADSLEPGHIHSTRHSPPPLTPDSETSDLLSADDTLSAITTPNPDFRPVDGSYLEASSDKRDLF